MGKGAKARLRFGRALGKVVSTSKRKGLEGLVGDIEFVRYDSLEEAEKVKRLILKARA